MSHRTVRRLLLVVAFALANVAIAAAPGKAGWRFEECYPDGTFCCKFCLFCGICEETTDRTHLSASNPAAERVR